VVPLADRDARLAEYIQQCPAIGRMRDRMETAEVLRVNEIRVRTMLDKYVHNLHQALARRPLQRCCRWTSSERVDFGALIDEICARWDPTSNRGEV
jgi:hypothetical protein